MAIIRYSVRVLVVVLLGVAGSLRPSLATPRLKVAATIFPLYDLVRQVAGPDVEVILLVPPGASPHTFAAKPSTIRMLTGSAAIFAIGHTLDDWVVQLAQEAGVPRTCVVDTHISLRPWDDARHDHASASAQTVPHGTVDPHYWLAIPNAMRMVQTIATTLADLDPAAQQRYVQQAAVYQQQLEAVDREIRNLFQGLLRRDMATFHPAFGYFAAAYNLQVVATFEASPGVEPGPRQVEHFLQQIQTHQLHVLFVEPQLPQHPLYSLAHDLGVTLQELDPIGGSQDRQSYVALMRFNAAHIAAALRE